MSLLLEPKPSEQDCGAGQWCGWCWAVCPGLDAEGFCLLADRREIDARIARLRGEVAPPAQGAPSEPTEVRIPREEALEAELTPCEDAGPRSLRCLWRAGERDWWRYEVRLNGATLERVRSAGPGWVKITTADERGFVKVVDHLDDLPSRVLLGDVRVQARRKRERCPVLALAEQVTGWQAEAVQAGPSIIGRLLPCRHVSGEFWFVVEVTAIYPSLRMARAVVVVAECSESEAREICADYNDGRMAA